MQQGGNHNANGVAIVPQTDGDSVDKEGNQETATRTLEDHSYKLVGKGLLFFESFEEFAA